MERVWRRETKMIRVLEAKIYENQLQELGRVGLIKRRTMSAVFDLGVILFAWGKIQFLGMGWGGEKQPSVLIVLNLL